MESKQDPASAHWEGVIPGKPCLVRGRASRQQLVTACGSEPKDDSGGGCASTSAAKKNTSGSPLGQKKHNFGKAA